nr:hypothetical protein [Luteimicrobium album]
MTTRTVVPWLTVEPSPGETLITTSGATVSEYCLVTVGLSPAFRIACRAAATFCPTRPWGTCVAWSCVGSSVGSSVAVSVGVCVAVGVQVDMVGSYSGNCSTGMSAVIAFMYVVHNATGHEPPVIV